MFLEPPTPSSPIPFDCFLVNTSIRQKTKQPSALLLVLFWSASMKNYFSRLGTDCSSQTCKPCGRNSLISEDVFQELMEREALGFFTSRTQWLPKPPITPKWNRRRLNKTPGPWVIHCLQFQQSFLAAETTNPLPVE